MIGWGWRKLGREEALLHYDCSPHFLWEALDIWLFGYGITIMVRQR